MAGWELNFCDLHNSGERAVEIDGVFFIII